MTDLRETVRAKVERACRNFRPAPDCDLEAEIVSAATDAIMSEIAKARAEAWRTMESAPRDGTPVLVYAEDMYGADDPGGPRSRIVVSWYDESGWAWLTTHYPPKFWQPLPASPGMDAVEIVSEPALVVTNAMVEAAAVAISERNASNTGVPWPIQLSRADARAALTAALPHAKTEAQVRAEWTEKLAKLALSDASGLCTERYLPDERAKALRYLADWLRSKAGGGG